MLEEEFNENKEKEILFEREREIKGVKTRLLEKRPELFDLFYINSGFYPEEYPTLCPSYCLLNSEQVIKFIGSEFSRELTKNEIEKSIKRIEFFINFNKYWKYLNYYLEEFLNNFSEDLLIPFNEEILKTIQFLNINELEILFLTLENQIKFEIEETQLFYQQLYHKIKKYFSISYLDFYHNNLLKKIIKQLPKRDLDTNINNL